MFSEVALNFPATYGQRWLAQSSHAISLIHNSWPHIIERRFHAKELDGNADTFTYNNDATGTYRKALTIAL